MFQKYVPIVFCVSSVIMPSGIMPSGIMPSGVIEATSSDMDRTPSEDQAYVYIISPQAGDIVKSPVTIVFGLSGMGVAPAGTDRPKTGHHHLILNAALPDLNETIPSDENYIHFGGGQTQVTLDLEAGHHSLQILFGDQNHVPHMPALYSNQITITVKD